STSFPSRDRSHPWRRVPIRKTNHLHSARSRSRRKPPRQNWLLGQPHPTRRAADRRNIRPCHPTARRRRSRTPPIVLSLPLPAFRKGPVARDARLLRSGGSTFFTFTEANGLT